MSISVAPGAMGKYQYTVRVKSDKSRCKRHRKVVVWHDENGNGLLDEGEFVIGEGRTNRSGKLSFQSTALPPVGDFIGVYVKGNDRCDSFEDSTEFTGFPD